VPRPERIQSSKVKENLTTRTIGHPLLCFRMLASTNDMAKELAKIGAKEGTVILAETQFGGRGRMNRMWVSPPGGIWFSTILRPNIEPRHAAKLTLTASVGIAKAVMRLFPLRVEIKWPNDILVNHRKVCGILTEAKTTGEALDFVIVGVGINVNFSLNALPSSFRDSATTLMAELKKPVDREALFCALLEGIEACYNLFKEGKFEVILKEWRSLASFLGFYVKVVSQKETIEGKAVDVDDGGALMVKLKDQTVRRVTSGDLTILRVME